MSIVGQIIVGSIIAVIAALFGALLQRRIDNKKRKNDFYLEYYKDLWSVIQNVDGIIRRGRKINHGEIMKPIQAKYSCGDINSYLKNCVRFDDVKLIKLLNNFSENIISYSEEITRLKFRSMGNGQIDYKSRSNNLAESIRKRIEKHLSK